MEDEVKEQVKKQIEAKIDETVKKIEVVNKKQVEDYKANKAERDAEAFKVCDVSGDGTLQLDEVIAILTPESPKMIAFMSALGINPEASQETVADCQQM